MQPDLNSDKIINISRSQVLSHLKLYFHKLKRIYKTGLSFKENYVAFLLENGYFAIC